MVDKGSGSTVLHFYIFKDGCTERRNPDSISGHYDCVHDWEEEFVVFKYCSIIKIRHEKLKFYILFQIPDKKTNKKLIVFYEFITLETTM